jgi:hypothetical protein
LLITRIAYEAIGGLDERFGLGLFDDDDLAMRARWAGFELAVAHDLFVHHFGSRTFVGSGIDAERLLEEKWPAFRGEVGNRGCAETERQADAMDRRTEALGTERATDEHRFTRMGTGDAARSAPRGR